MHVSLQTRHIAETNTRIQARRRFGNGADDSDILRIMENPNDGRRQGSFSRRPRPDNARARDSEDYAGQMRPSLMRSAAQSNNTPFSAIAKTAEFWTLLGAVAPDETLEPTGENPSPATPRNQPSLEELLARVIATH
ncbi:MAG: hypothetical protein P4L76_05380 [Beijerinckiaceae bacterium]|nr:hypothetical protein [Beijerinckiaceae bacterium]